MKDTSFMTDPIYSFICKNCGDRHALNLCFGAEHPDYYYSVPPEERGTRIELTKDLCVVDAERFFIRGRIAIPVVDYEDDVVFNVWTSLSEKNFLRTTEMWNDPKRVNEPAYFGWLQTSIPGYSDTLNIRTIVHTNEVGIIPTVEVIEDLHPLKTDQKNGISLEMVKEINQIILH